MEIAALQAKVDALMAEPAFDEIVAIYPVLRPGGDTSLIQCLKAAVTAFLRARATPDSR